MQCLVEPSPLDPTIMRQVSSKYYYIGVGTYFGWGGGGGGGGGGGHRVLHS